MKRVFVIICLAAGCGAGAPRATSSTAGGLQATEKGPGLRESMLHHFTIATAARDAVIAGKLEEVRAPLEQLATGRESAEMPDDWLPWIEDMKAAARKGAAAKTLEEAAASVAVLGTTCGECHRTTRGGLRDAARSVHPYDPGGRKGLEEKMARHKYSADAMWVGITGPVHQDWADGAAALMNIEVPGLVDQSGKKVSGERSATGEGELSGTPDPRLPAQDGSAAPASTPSAIDLDVALRELRALGTEADQAKIASEKQITYARIIARCGGCHAALGVDAK